MTWRSDELASARAGTCLGDWRKASSRSPLFELRNAVRSKCLTSLPIQRPLRSSGDFLTVPHSLAIVVEHRDAFDWKFLMAEVPDNMMLFDDEAHVAVEEEDLEGDLIIKPWDPKQIRITTKTFSVRELFSQIGEGELDLSPDFQRSFVWSPAKQVKLIESILLGIPLPAFYFNQDHQGAFQVIDGVQRLTTIQRFMSNALPLNAGYLEYLTDLEGMTYDTLESPVRRRFAGTQTVAHVIEPQTPDEVKYDIFNRVNTGGSPLTPQEIRHCMSKNTSRQLLRTLVESPSFDKATAFTFFSRDPSSDWQRDNQRMADRELALRFCAFRSTSIAEYEKANTLDGFLLEFTRRIDRGELSAEDLPSLIRSFDRAMVNSAEILEGAAFRRWPLDATRRGPINRAVFEAQALALADYDLNDLTPYKDEIVLAFRKLFSDPLYDAAIRSGTGNPRKVERRLSATRNVVRAIVS